MRIAFANLSRQAAPPPPGELQLRPADPGDLDRTDLTALALEKGLGGFVRGDGPVLRIVAPLDPTLDDMAAVLVLQEELGGKARPPAAAFARYVASLRKGIRPTDKVPLEESAEALFLHFRHRAGDPLSDEVRAARFLADWNRLAVGIREALARGADPHREALFGEESPFEEERHFLRKDRPRYERYRDAGERFLVRLPGEKGWVPALFLRRPLESSLFKFWARNDASAPGGAGFRFLAVWWGKGSPTECVFSTDPVDCRPIDSLATALQDAELRRNPQHPADDPWGVRFDNSMVVSPKKGTALSEAEVVTVLRQWGEVRSRRLRRDS